MHLAPTIVSPTMGIYEGFWFKKPKILFFHVFNDFKSLPADEDISLGTDLKSLYYAVMLKKQK